MCVSYLFASPVGVHSYLHDLSVHCNRPVQTIMALSLLCRVLVFLFALKLFSVCLEGECRELLFPGSFFFANKRLLNHTIRAKNVSDIDRCGLICYQEPNCVSINYETSTNHCELNSATHQKHSDEFVNTEGFFYRGAVSACDAAPCINGGTCQSGFTDKRYRCLCLLGFTGEHCENEPYETIGCFNDGIPPAIATLEGQDSILNGDYKTRQDAIVKCYLAAKKRELHVFAVQDGGMCSASAEAHQTFDQYGKYNACKADGEGGLGANEVYYITGYDTVGCYKDTGNRAIPTMEGRDPTLDGPYSVRVNPIAKCAVAALRAGYSMFAVQDGGWCAASATADQTYDKHGPSTACRADGEGGSWTNQVYALNV